MSSDTSACAAARLSITVRNAVASFNNVVMSRNMTPFRGKSGTARIIAARSGRFATIASVMPDHGHGSPTNATITANGDGTYSISGINLSMRGVWQVTLTIASPQMNDAASFDFCVDGT